MQRKPFILQNPSTLIVLAGLAVFTVAVTALSQAYGTGAMPTSMVKVLGKTLCLALAAVAMDLVWGYLGILSLGQMAFFALGGYMIGQWLMYARTEAIVAASMANNAIPPTPLELQEGVANQIFGVVGSADLPLVWSFAHSLPLQMLLVLAVPGLLALVFGWLAFRSRVNGVYLSILTQAMTLALALWLFQNDSGFRGNNGLSGLQNIPGLDTVSQARLSVWFLWASAFALGLGYLLAAWVVSGKFGSVIRAIRDDETRVRFLGYPVEGFKLVVFTLAAMITAIAGALYYPQAGIINPAELAPIASIYLAVWVAIGGRGRLYGAVIGAVVVSLLSSWFTGGRAPDLSLPFYTIKWVDWWLVALGLSFVLVTLFAPRGIAGLFDWLGGVVSPRRQGRDLGPDQGALQEQEAKA
ncbi:urea ABC transporter permease subunit UrtC [Paracoccus sp. R12_1]|uniref:urea ABC transporter permease subunit UrtC n=1 Tax=unclassified Paracoccus (in: a-proteobacteria) TaxID=2688777 RepID=UPI001ADB86C2|nr:MULTISPECIES: urea ABC transporter permease subunit UrtC [unclassified Paracoccus (in: a-proteobacteria)]MBO9453710.1 urea ABC transporter permease subunit UrtC [Paracoccus sp. R12_2]MBO9486866.1 urea ABC transporter permease subunit UrtC [Paracoccus sp. R12_1]